ncbi:hypothetical protein TNCV_801091 [Trichonephila clavipes]|nr:hypothetical protein TNCV_801091 [Trichonephila clavipes]
MRSGALQPHQFNTSSAEVFPSSIEDSAPSIWRREVDVSGSFRSDFACFFDGVCLLGEAVWRLAGFRFGCEAGGDAIKSLDVPNVVFELLLLESNRLS